MRLSYVQIASGLLLTLPTVGCHRAEGKRVANASTSGAEHPSKVSAPRKDTGPIVARATKKDTGPIVVRVKYHVARGPCIHGEDGSWAMPSMDSFEVVEVIQGRLKASHIDVRPSSLQGPAYPKNLAESDTLTLCLNLSDETLKQAEENQQRGYPWLIVDGNEVEQTITSGVSPFMKSR